MQYHIHYLIICFKSYLCSICRVRNASDADIYVVFLHSFFSCDACAGEVCTEGGFTLTLFQGWGLGIEVLLEQVQLNFSFPNKFIILLPCGLLVDNHKFLKMCFFESLTGYTDYGGYVVKRDSAYTHIRVNDHTVSDKSVFVHG
jgi:hypothetical protein